MEIMVITYFERCKKCIVPIRSHPKLMERLSIYCTYIASVTIGSEHLSSFQEFILRTIWGGEAYFSPFRWGKENFICFPRSYTLMEQEFEARCFKSFSCLDGNQIPCDLLNGWVLDPAHPDRYPSSLIPSTSSNMWSIVPSVMTKWSITAI